MAISRRTFLTSSAALAAMSACRTKPPAAGGPPPAPAPAGSPPVAARPLSLLILGGTGFLGPHIVRAALARGHRMTLFNRGKTDPDLFAELPTLHGDRDGKLDALRGHTWDGVIDTSGFVPRLVGMSAKLLASAVKQYVFVSSISVYADTSKPGIDEASPVATLDDPASEDVRRYYGPLKAASERAAEAAMPGRVTVVRPGLIVGPRDKSDRFTYWPVRVARGGEVLAPGDGKDPVQFVDARDLAAFLVHALETGATGVFDATGPRERLEMADLLATCRTVTGASATFTWVDAAFLAAHGLEPWGDLPAWIPRGGDGQGFTTVSSARAIAAGFAFRPLADTVRDTLAWWNAQPAERRTLRAGPSPAKEAEVLAAWHARPSAAAGSPPGAPG